MGSKNVVCAGDGGDECLGGQGAAGVVGNQDFRAKSTLGVEHGHSRQQRLKAVGPQRMAPGAFRPRLIQAWGSRSLAGTRGLFNGFAQLWFMHSRDTKGTKADLAEDIGSPQLYTC